MRWVVSWHGIATPLSDYNKPISFNRHQNSHPFGKKIQIKKV